jgi:hypothetical protein
MVKIYDKMQDEGCEGDNTNENDARFEDPERELE